MAPDETNYDIGTRGRLRIVWHDEIQTHKLGLGKGRDSESKILNRIARCGNDGWSLEAGPRHAELVIEQLDVGSSRAAVTLGIDGREEEDTEEDIEIIGADAARFRGVATRCNYLAFDRPDTQFATKEIP